MQVSTRVFTKRTVSKGDKGWDGTNVTSNAFGFDDFFSGQPFGAGEFGGMEHFRNRTEVEVSH